MSTFEELSFCSKDFTGAVRLFPLPNLVLFPHVMQPLHVFEPRYCELLEDAMADDRLIAMAVLRPGWENDYEGWPPIYPVACLGQIASSHKLDDGTYNVLMMGLHRVQLLGELRSEANFRTAVAELCEDICPVQEATARAVLHEQLRKAFLQLVPSLPEAQGQLEQLLGGDISLGVLTDLISYMLDIEVSEKEALLAEANICRRASLLLRHLSVAATDDRVGLGKVFPPQFSMN
ncbi:MAG: LON peptidase substrate-binding domain-containing protein [Thermoguttaceae bacterium]